jgi:hypothetical protein
MWLSSPLDSKMENNYLRFFDIPKNQYTDITSQVCCKKLGVVLVVDIDPVITFGAPVIVGLSASQGRIVFVAPRKEGIWCTFR